MKKLIYILPLLFFAQIIFGQQTGTLQTWKIKGGGGGGGVDTTSLSNRINLKLAIADTTGKWLSAGTVIPAQVNIIEGTNITVTGTYPNITISSTGGGSTDTTSLSNRINSKQDTSYHTNFYAESPQLVRDTLVIEGADTVHGVISSLDNLNMPELSYESASRDTTNWRTNNTLVDEQFLTDRISSSPISSAVEAALGLKFNLSDTSAAFSPYARKNKVQYDSTVLATAINLRALDANVMHKTGTDSVNGAKSFFDVVYLKAVSDVSSGDFLTRYPSTGQILRRTASEALTDMNGMNAFYSNLGPIDMNTIGQGFHSQYSGGFTNGPTGIVYGGTILYSGSNTNNLQFAYDNGNTDGIGTLWYRLRSSDASGGLHSWQKTASTTYVDTTIFPDKRWVIFGDSFSSDDAKYWGTVRDKLKLTSITTFGISGQNISQQSAVLDSLLTATPTYFSNVKIVSILIGINDFGQGQPLGTISDTAGQATYAGHLKHMIEKILTANPKVELYILTPPEANSVSVPYKSTNSAGWTVRQMSVLISQICANYSVQCIDLYDLSQFNLLTIPTLTVDGLHPNSEGSKFLGNIVANAFLNRNNKGAMTRTPAQALSDIGAAAASTTPTISSGSGAPSSTPAKIGDEYIDLTNKKDYKAMGTSSSADWVILN